MKLYYSPGSCALGIHILLEEIAKPYDAHKISFADKEQYGAAFKAINPKSKVPTLIRDDGSVLTEFPAIALWLALTNPGAKLLPEDADGQARALEMTDYIVATVHMQAFSRIFRPERYSPTASDKEAVMTQGREMVDAAFALISERLGDRPYLGGSYSIADAALFYVEYWAVERVKIALPANCQRHFQTMKARPAVQRALAAEGLE